MAQRAENRRVRAGKREACGGVVKRRVGPRACRVTLLAGRGHSCFHMIRIRRPLEIRHVATRAIRVR